MPHAFIFLHAVHTHGEARRGLAKHGEAWHGNYNQNGEKKMPVRKGRLKRPCRKCEKMFAPSGRSEKICHKCKMKIPSYHSNYKQWHSWQLLKRKKKARHNPSNSLK